MLEDHPADMAVFMAISAHDMKNSLNMLSGVVERFLVQHTPEGFSGYEDLSLMLYEIKRINQGLVQLLALYKLGQRLYPFDPRPHVLSDFVDELMAQNQPLLAAHRVELTQRCPEELIGYFDEDLINSVTNQAINNATRYSKGRIHLSAQAGENGGVVLRVEDDGEGFPERMLRDGAQPGAVDFDSGSTGLGLYFAQTVAALHRNHGDEGCIQLENGGSLGGGCFILRLP